MAVTKRMILDVIRAAAVDGAVFGDEVTADDVINYVDTTIAQMDNKAAKAKEKAAEKKAEGDALRAEVEKVLTDEPKTIDEIVAAVNEVEGYEDVTRGKVVSRVTQLVRANVAHKETVKTEDGRKISAYALGVVAEDAE